MMLIRGLKHPNYFTYELKNNESIGRVWMQVVALIALSGFISGISAFYGIGSEYLARSLIGMPAEQYEMQKALFVTGQTLWGLFYGTMVIFLSAFWFWSLTDTEFKRYVVMQLLVMLILLLEKLLLIPISLYLGVPEASSPFSLGPIVQSFTDHSVLVTFFASISIFKVWVIWVQYQYVRALTEKSRAVVWALVLGLNLSYWLLGALFSIIQFEKII